MEDQEKPLQITIQLMRILEDLSHEEFEKFKWILQQDEVYPIRKRHLEKATIMDTVDKMKEMYNEGLVKKTIEVLKVMERNDLLQNLENLASKGKKRENKHTKLKYMCN